MWTVNYPPPLKQYRPSSLNFTPGWNSYILTDHVVGQTQGVLLYLIMSSERRSRSHTNVFFSITFIEPSIFYVLLLVLGWFETLCYHHFLLSRGRCHYSRFCDFLEELVVDGGTKTLSLHSRATCRGRSAGHFR